MNVAATATIVHLFGLQQDLLVTENKPWNWYPERSLFISGLAKKERIAGWINSLEWTCFLLLPSLWLWLSCCPAKLQLSAAPSAALTPLACEGNKRLLEMTRSLTFGASHPKTKTPNGTLIICIFFSNNVLCFFMNGLRSWYSSTNQYHTVMWPTIIKQQPYIKPTQNHKNLVTTIAAVLHKLTSTSPEILAHWIWEVVCCLISYASSCT